MADAITTEAETILKLPPVMQRRRLLVVLNRSAQERPGTLGHSRALDSNARLCTRLREIAEARRCSHPWTTAKA